MANNEEGPRMGDAVDEKLYGLIDIAEQQQSTVHMILDQLVQERADLAKQRDHWIKEMDSMSHGIEATVLDAVTSSMSNVVGMAAQTISDLGKPFADQMMQAAVSAEQAEQAFRNVIRWASARLLLWGIGAIASLLMLGWLASGIILWWDTKAIATAHITKQQLQAEVADLQANGDSWIRAGMTTTLKRCGPKKQPCVAVDESAGAFGENNDYRLLKSP
jgi:hypothetical protein